MLIPCRRHTSAVLAPASCSRKTPITCSSVNLDRFMVRSFQKARTLASPGGNYGGQVNYVDKDVEGRGSVYKLLTDYEYLSFGGNKNFFNKERTKRLRWM